MPRSRRILRALPILLLAVATVLVVVPWFRAPLGFDEAYNLQVVRNLVEGHGYATDGALYGGNRTLFDYQITTGPTVLLPSAGVAALLGQHLWAYRLVPVLATIGLVAAWFLLVRRHWGELPALAAGLSLLMLDNAAILITDRFGPGSVLGETASALFVVLAALALSRPAAAGLLAGLAVMTKVVVVLAVPALLLGVVLAARRGGRGIPTAIGWFAAGTVLPAVCWQVYRVASAGPAADWSSDRDFLHFLTSTGGSSTAAVSMPERLLEQMAAFGIAGSVAVILAVALVMRALRRDVRALVGSLSPDLVAVAAAGASLEIWWLLLEGQSLARHSMQATQLLLPLLAGAAARVLLRSSRTAFRDVLLVALPLLVAVQVAVAVYHGWNPPGPSLRDQRLVAQAVASRTHEFRYPPPTQDFELTPLAPISIRPLGPDGGVVVLSGMGGPASQTESCDHVLYEHAGYVVCRVDPTP